MKLLEDAADSLARFDAAVTAAPFGAATVLRLLCTAQLTTGTRESFHRLLAAEADPFHDAALTPAELAVRDLLVEEERRARSGGIPSLMRLTTLDPAIETYPAADRLEAALRAGSDRGVIERTLELTAWAPSTALGECLAALTLVSAGRTDRLILLPFLDAESRADAHEAWQAGDEAPWRALALPALIAQLRTRHEALRAIAAGQSREDERLASLGRAAVTTRPVLDLLRRSIILTMPIVAEDLDCSRPAAQLRSSASPHSVWPGSSPVEGVIGSGAMSPPSGDSAQRSSSATSSEQIARPRSSVYQRRCLRNRSSFGIACAASDITQPCNARGRGPHHPRSTPRSSSTSTTGMDRERPLVRC